LAASSGATEKLSGIKTEILVAWIFALLIAIVWAILFLTYLIGFGLLAASTCYAGYCTANPFAAIAIIYGIFFFIWMIPSILVLRRTNKLRGAANKGDISTLKQLNSIGWAIVALIFTFVPGIMLLVAHGPIESLGTAEMARASGAIDLDKLTKLKSLLDSGAITKEEFESQKNLVLHPGTAQEQFGPEAELRKLKALYESGTLTQSEYEDQKRKILNGMA